MVVFDTFPSIWLDSSTTTKIPAPTKQQLDNTELEKRMEKQIHDCAFWMERYSKAFKDNDTKMGVIDSQVNGRMETLEY